MMNKIVCYIFAFVIVLFGFVCHSIYVMDVLSDFVMLLLLLIFYVLVFSPAVEFWYQELKKLFKL